MERDDDSKKSHLALDRRSVVCAGFTKTLHRFISRFLAWRAWQTYPLMHEHPILHPVPDEFRGRFGLRSRAGRLSVSLACPALRVHLLGADIRGAPIISHHVQLSEFFRTPIDHVRSRFDTRKKTGLSRAVLSPVLGGATHEKHPGGRRGWIDDVSVLDGRSALGVDRAGLHRHPHQRRVWLEQWRDLRHFQRPQEHRAVDKAQRE
jgi:hypothetical protein